MRVVPGQVDQNMFTVMRYVAAYLLAVLGGKKEPQLDDIQKILAAVGVDCDDSKAKKVIESCKGHDVNDLIEQG
ncbi:unnamed protein product [Soboliphyme baturini]|uniref:Large ribosomal subunit protein P2 n=1 Tax=Soboliphyme baturini TaxID=241478 RepID=A0A183I9B7_9BILA|nr:unnamed protein product [Soboliphyme baturini]